MLYNNVTLRHELKYYISRYEYNLIRARLRPLLTLDENSDGGRGYFIRSLYFDDMYDSAMKDKLSGASRRDKYRIRIYNLSDRVIKLERKSKYDSYISKVSASLKRAQVDELLEGRYESLLAQGHHLTQELYALRRSVLLRPAVIVDYTREAYVLREGNVRVTFDKDVRAGAGSFNIFSDGIATYPVVDKDMCVLEIKYDDFLPDYVRGILLPIVGHVSAISKYVLCRQRIGDVSYVSRRVERSANG